VKPNNLSYLAPELARSRDYFTGIEVGGGVSQRNYATFALSYHRTTPRAPAAAFGARALVLDVRVVESANFAQRS